MKKTMKKFYSYIMVIVMILSMTGLSNLIAQAEEVEAPKDTDVTAVPEDGEPIGAVEEISTIEVTIEPPLLGATDTSVKLAVPEGANYTVTPTSNWENAGRQEAQIIENMTHAIVVSVTPNDGYTLAQDAIVKVNGSDEDVNLLGGADSPASSFEYFCEPQILGTISQVNLTGVPQGNIGETATPYSATGTNYTVAGYWSKYSATTGNWEVLNDTHIFASGNIYRLRLVVSPEVGYGFDDYVTLTVNGEHKSFDYISDTAWYDINISYGVEITQAAISEDSLPKAVIGQSFSDERINIAVPEGSNYTAYAYWRDEYGMGNGVFEDGKAYFLELTISPKEGYSLAESFDLYIGEEYYNLYSDGATLIYTTRITFADVIDEVEISTPEAVVGGTIHKGENGSAFFDLEVPAGSNYTAGACWYDQNGDIPVEATFEAGKYYELFVQIMPNPGYEFTDALIIKNNGIAEKIWAAPTHSFYSKTYSFRQSIDRIEVTGVAEPAVGNAPTTEGLKVPDGANYYIASANWIDADDGSSPTVFEAGHDYDLSIQVEPKDGYEIAIDAVLLLDGKAVDNRAYYSDFVSFGAFYSLKDIITEVRVDNVPEMKIGETAKAQVTVPGDANYTANAHWTVWNDKNRAYEPFNGVFEAGKTYRLSVSVSPEAGYRLDIAVTKFYVNGKTTTDVTALGIELIYEAKYTEGAKLIDKIEITVGEPIIGNHASIEPVVTIPEGAEYYVDGTPGMSSWIKGESGNYIIYLEYFKDGDTYGAIFGIVANEGYVFADDLVVIVNGKALSPEDFYIDPKYSIITYFFDSQCSHKYSDWSANTDGTHTRRCTVCGHEEAEKHVYTDASGTKCSVCGQAKNDGSPATGDDLSLGFMFMIMALCGAGIITLSRAKKDEE